MLDAVGTLRPGDKSHANVLIKRVVDRLDGRYILRDALLDDKATLLIQWGFKPTKALRCAILRKIPYVIIDLGYFDAARTKRYSISINGFHGLSMPVAGVIDLPPRPHPRVRAWREDGDIVQIIGQMPTDAAIYGLNMETWMHKAAVDAAEAFGKPAFKRVHPKMLNPWEAALEPLSETFDTSYAHVTWTSTSAVQSVLAGVPTVAMHPGSPAFEVCSHGMHRSRLPGRQAWVHKLAHREYALAEDGDCDVAVEYILRDLDRATDLARWGEVLRP